MNLVKDNWTKDDIKPFLEYLDQFKREEKVDWTRNIINTNMKVLAVLSKDMKNIIKEIGKGNYISFLDLEIDDSYESLAVSGGLLSKIKDFDTYREYLLRYSKKIDNWALCDTLTFNVKGNEENYLFLVEELIKSELPFERRIGISIFFAFISYDEYLDLIFNTVDKFYDETDYYVQMMIAWLVCELMIKRRNETMKYLEHNNLNKFTVNKMISKCRDSFRVSDEDKEMLKSYRK